MVLQISPYSLQPKQQSEGLSSNRNRLLATAATGVGIAGSGFIKTNKGRFWDRYLAAIRAVEAGSPGGVLRTFRMSEFLSPLESWNTVSAFPADIRSGSYGRYLKASFGQAKSFSLTRTGTIFGEVRDETGKLLGMGLNIEAGTQKGAAIADFYARIEGIQLGQYDSLNDAILRNKWRMSKSPLPYAEWLQKLEPHLRRQRLIIGSRLREKIRILGKDIYLSENMAKNVAKAETTGKLLRAKAASTASRLNILLRAPFEVPGVKKVVDKIPGLSSMAVKPGTAMQMLGRYTGRAMLAGAVYKGVEYLDYLRSEDSPWVAPLSIAAGGVAGAILAKKPGMVFSKGGAIAGAALGLYTALAPRFDEGLFYGVASIYADVRQAHARMSETLGFTEAIQQQDKITPGLMDFKTGLAFGGVGALAAGLTSYSAFAGVAIKNSLMNKMPLAQAFEGLREKGFGFLDKFWSSRAAQKIPGSKMLSKIRNPMMLGFLGGMAAWAGASATIGAISGHPGSFLANILGSRETEQELADIYSGRKEVAVRKGRFWEFGRGTSYAGGRIDYYRPHALARLKARAFQKGMWGSEKEKWAHDPILHPLKAMFGSDEWKYYYEQKYMYERPAPLTGSWGEEIPFIGPVIAATFGKIFKPRKEIRPEEWKTPGGGYTHRPDIRGETEPSYGLGGLGPGAPVSPEDPGNIINELNYRRREAVGLAGFAEASMTKDLIGREEWLPNKRTLGTMGKETGAEYWLWSHLNVGGAGGTSEAVRRFIPRTRSYLETYNPLRNALPDWLPDDYFLDLKYGNPFCLTKNTYVELKNLQFDTANNILQNDILISAHGEETQVTKRSVYANKEIIKITISKNSSFPIECSKEHPIAIRKLVKGRKRHARVQLYKNANKILKEISYGGKRIEISQRAGVSASVACSCWKLLEEYNKIKITRNGKFGSVQLLDSEPFDEKLLDRGILFVNAKDIKIGDYIAYPKPIRNKTTIEYIDLADVYKWSAVTDNYIYYNRNQESAECLEYFLGESKKQIPKHITKKYTKNRSRDIRTKQKYRYKRFIKLDRKFGLFLGMWCAEGTFTSTSHDTNEKHIVKELFNNIGLKYSWVTKENTNGTQATFYSKALGSLFVYLCGDNARNKKLHPVFWSAPEDFLKGFLNGLFFGDGCDFDTIGNRHVESLKTSSKILALQVKKLLLSLGIVSSVVYNKEQKSTIYKTKQTVVSGDSYNVNINNYGIDSLNCHWFKDSDEKYYYFRVNKIENIQLQDVYGWSTDSNTFCVAGAATHNSKIPEAEIRLPGRGYASLHPDVVGLSPEEYPLAHRVKILGDVAMWSDEYKAALRQAKGLIREKKMSAADAALVMQTQEQVKEKKKRRTFSNYAFDKDQLTTQEVTVKSIVSPKRILTEELGDMAIEIAGVGRVEDKKAAMAFLNEELVGKQITIQTPSMESRRYIKRAAGPTMTAAPMLGGKDVGLMMSEAGYVAEKPLKDELAQIRYSAAERIAGRMSEKLLHGIDTPLEYLTPLSPVSKLIRQRSPVEEYAATEAIGTGASFWDKPLQNFIYPFVNMSKYKAGSKEIPEEIQQRRDIQEYFDMLKWVKTSRLEKKAEELGAMELAEEYKKQREATVFGTDVFKSPVNIMRALPRRERDFFGEFSKAKSEKEQQEILNLLPQNERRLYESQWLRQKERAAYIKRKAKINTEEDDKTIAIASQMRKSEGFEYRPSDRKDWWKETNGEVEFDDWLREGKAKEYFQTHSLPGAEWLGWHPQVDLQDVAMKFVETAGLDHHDFDLWGQRKRALARKPYINEELIDEMAHGSEYSNSYKVAKNSQILTKMFKEHHPEITQSQADAELQEDKYNINVYDKREKLVKGALKEFGVR